MKQDRKLNRWILISSILGIFASVVLLLAGAGLAVLGYVKPELVTKVDEIVFFLNQEVFVKMQLNLFNDKLLQIEFLYLFAGIFVAAVGLIALIFAIVGLKYAKKHIVVKHRVALLIFTLIPLAIAGSSVAYLVLESEMFKTDIKIINNIKYVCYGIVGLFGIISLFNILGVLFSRSEKFMSNDNQKYAFGNSSIRGNRTNINSNTATANQARPMQQVRPKTMQSNQMQGQPIRVAHGQPIKRPEQSRPTNPQQKPVGVQQRSQVARPAQGQPVRTAPISRMSAKTSAQARPNNVQSTQPRIVGQMQNRPQARRCPRCGKVLAPGEKVCTSCGYKIIG